MVRVSLKNTFLSFDENDVEEEDDDFPRVSSRQAASPRSRSLECPSPNRMLEEHQQIKQLNRLLVSDSKTASPAVGPTGSPRRPSSPGASPGSQPTGGGVLEGLSMLPNAAVPGPAPTPPRRSSCSSGAASSSQAMPSQKKPLPFGSEGPSAQELRQLQRRLEEACQSRGRKNSEDGTASASNGAERCKVTHVASACSVSTMANESSEESEETNAGQAQAQAAVRLKPPMIHPVRSTNSVCSLASEIIEDRGETNYGETVEFDLTIEEDPQAHVAQAQRWSEQSEEVSEDLQMDAPSPSGSASPTGSPPSSSPRSRMYSAPDSPKSGSPRDSRFSQWRPLPKEYRHGHVPKNLNLAEEYQNTDKVAPPTTLMIRNIPNRYTQRELIMELEDLGFASTFDFLYIPLDKGTMSNVGYAFVNFVEPEWAEKCMAAFQNYRFKRHRKISGKIAAISVAHIQGLEANLAHYENAAVNTAKLKQRRPVIMANISQSLSDALLDE